MEMAGGDHAIARARRRERERLIPLRGAVHAEEAEVGAPELRGEALGLPEQVAAQVEVVDAGREREVQTKQVVDAGAAPACARAS